MKLISMVDFVLEQTLIFKNKGETLKKITDYTNFLNQPLTLGMFIACDEDGNVLNEKEIRANVMQGNDTWDEYQNALERIFFKGFDEDMIFNIFFNKDGVWRLSKKVPNIEFLVKYNLTLTQSAIKQLGYDS